MIKNKYAKIAIVALIILVIAGIFVYKKFIYKEKEEIDLNQEVKMERITTFIDFSAEGCKPCERMEVLLRELKEEYAGVIDIKQLDVYANINLANQYGITSTPTQIFLDENGNVVYAHVGFLGKSKIKEIFKKSGVEL